MISNENDIKLNDGGNIFNFINPSDNDMFSDISKDELMNLLNYINNYDLVLRDSLGLNTKDTFGVELEFEKVLKLSSISNKLYGVFGNSEWAKLKFDFTLKYYGYEINSPVLRDGYDSWDSLDKVCSIVREEGVITNRCGGHVHVGAHVLGNDMNSWINFVMLWSVYENIIYRFCYGGYLTARLSILEHAKPVDFIYWKNFINFSKNSSLDIWDLIHKVSDSRCQAVNFSKVKDFNEEKIGNTIEFRCPNGTIDPVIWQNYVNLFVKVLKYCRSTNFDRDTVFKRRNINEDDLYTLENYKNIYLEQAVEFCDMVFDNNLDKVYFMRQYLKSFDVGKGCLEPAKSFTKTLNKRRENRYG